MYHSSVVPPESVRLFVRVYLSICPVDIMLSYLLILALASAVTAAPSHQRRATGCGSVAPFAAGTFNTATFQTSDGTTREYGVWLPTRYSQNTQTRVIFSYHGASGTIDTQRALDELANPAFNTDHMVVYLQGVGFMPVLMDLRTN